MTFLDYCQESGFFEGSNRRGRQGISCLVSRRCIVRVAPYGFLPVVPRHFESFQCDQDSSPSKNRLSSLHIFSALRLWARYSSSNTYLSPPCNIKITMGARSDHIPRMPRSQSWIKPKYGGRKAPPLRTFTNLPEDTLDVPLGSSNGSGRSAASNTTRNIHWKWPLLTIILSIVSISWTLKYTLLTPSSLQSASDRVNNTNNNNNNNNRKSYVYKIPEKYAAYVPPSDNLNGTIVEGALSFAERAKFQRSPVDYNVTFFQAPKPTPSGWWPDHHWIKQCVKQDRVLEPFPTAGDWVGYRLGDCIKRCSGCPGKRKHHDLASTSIAGQYNEQACKTGLHVERGNETLLDELLAARDGKKGFYKPDPDAMVVHLRLGDKIELSRTKPTLILSDGGDPHYNPFHGFGAIKSVYEILTEISLSNLTKVVVRGGSHWPDAYRKSRIYSDCLYQAATKAGYEASINVKEVDADADFYFLSHARHIITSVGGYSRYVGHAVLRRGGILYGRYF